MDEGLEADLFVSPFIRKYTIDKTLFGNWNTIICFDDMEFRCEEDNKEECLKSIEHRYAEWKKDEGVYGEW